jgi:hypothetical protein
VRNTRIIPVADLGSPSNSHLRRATIIRTTTGFPELQVNFFSCGPVSGRKRFSDLRGESTGHIASVSGSRYTTVCVRSFAGCSYILRRMLELSNEWRMEMEAPVAQVVLPVQVDGTLHTSSVERRATDERQGVLRYSNEGNQKEALMPFPYGEVRSIPSATAGRAEMPVPPKFWGVLDNDVTSVEAWFQDVQHYATYTKIPFRTALEALTEGAVLLNVVNMPQDAATAELSDTAFVDKFVMIHRQQAQPDCTQEQQLLCSHSAAGPSSNVAVHVGNVQAAHSASKRARFHGEYGLDSQQMDVQCSSGRTDFEQAVFHLGMQFGVCGGCLGFVGNNMWHRWADCVQHKQVCQVQ